jgi:hypothetical protein
LVFYFTFFTGGLLLNSLKKLLVDAAKHFKIVNTKNGQTKIASSNHLQRTKTASTLTDRRQRKKLSLFTYF